jgi:hypothetical protein
MIISVSLFGFERVECICFLGKGCLLIFMGDAIFLLFTFMGDAVFLLFTFMAEDVFLLFTFMFVGAMVSTIL